MEEENSKKIEDAKGTINDLFEKYKNDSFMFSKTTNYICNQFPTILERIKQTREEQLARNENMTQDLETFIEYFLNTNRYYYYYSTEKFFFYDGKHYKIYKEDDILYNVLSSITQDNPLLTWKQRTKVYIMKRIKDKSILTSIPESYTIQSVLELLYPMVFSSKIEAKYFLTILGDNILKKNTHLIHYLNPKAKKFITELNLICQTILNLNLYQSFKYKYHEQHSYNDCRLLNINDTIKTDNIWTNVINNSALDIICVACHYSNRYKGSDNVIINLSNDNELTNKIFYLKNTSKDVLIEHFINEMLQISDSYKTSIVLTDEQTNTIRTPNITWKNMQYLWKQFLNSKTLPTIMFQSTLKTCLIEKLNEYYNDDIDSFIGVCSKFLPDIQIFLLFWNNNIEIDNNEKYFEIEELVILFRKWCNTNNETIPNLNDKQILDLISYYFPDIEIERDKYICNIKCSLWDKKTEIHIALEDLKENLLKQFYNDYGGINNFERTNSPFTGYNISIYDAYTHYYKFYSTMNKPVASKIYFEKYIFDNLTDFIVDTNFISNEWLL